MVEEIVPEWKKALDELHKVAVRGLPEDKMRKNIIKGLTKQGIDKQRAENLADWAIRFHQKMQMTPEEKKRYNEIKELIEQRLAESKSKEKIVEELLTQGLDEEIAKIRVDSVLELKKFEEKLQNISADLQRKQKEKQLDNLVLGSVLVVSLLVLRLAYFFYTQSNPILGILLTAGVLLLGGILTILWVSTRL